MHTESTKQGCMNLRGQGQRTGQGHVTKMTYFNVTVNINEIFI